MESSFVSTRGCHCAGVGQQLRTRFVFALCEPEVGVLSDETEYFTEGSPHARANAIAEQKKQRRQQSCIDICCLGLCRVCLGIPSDYHNNYTFLELLLFLEHVSSLFSRSSSFMCNLCSFWAMWYASEIRTQQWRLRKLASTSSVSLIAQS